MQILRKHKIAIVKQSLKLFLKEIHMKKVAYAQSATSYLVLIARTDTATSCAYGALTASLF